MSSARPLVIGGGPAGAAAAIRLAMAGTPALLVERNRTIGDALCGGFLSWRTLDRLRALGVDPDAIGGHRVTRLALIDGTRETVRALPYPALGLSRYAMDTALIERAIALGTEVRHATVRMDGAEAFDESGVAIPASAVFLASGKHETRGASRPRDAAGPDPFVGIRLRLAATPALARALDERIEMHMFEGGYCGVVLQDGASANLCMAVRKSRLARAGGKPAGLFAELFATHPILRERLAEMPDDAAFDAIGHVPYGWRARETLPGLFRLGDQAGCIPSFAGEGIGIALASAEAAVDAWVKGGAEAAPEYQRRFGAHIAGPVRTAGLVTKLSVRPSGASVLARLAAIPGATGLAGRLTRVS
ncbi:FAD-dependent monooxygenase [Novosphingobium sp.]|uniref:NAD(P)/FAD-dependent oxidoreductase n=1 Tax=Novosphingobium sp. TaxID=1874826 RepID=UPI0025E1E0F4|nr:FAD-dependent monooxygenase [Novosphingobium sp.]